MSISKYGKLLTVILTILIIGIVIGIGFLVWNYTIKPNKDNTEKQEAFAEIDRTAENEENEGNKNEVEQQPDDVVLNPDTNSTGSGGGSATRQEKPKYKGYVMLGYIVIPKTNVKEPILDSVTPETLNIAVATLYPSNPKLNEPGNVVIIGHNYRNGTFFSNNKKLSVGDKIQIKDNSGRELTYTIYQKFEASENDTSFYNRDTKGATEITLSTCTDDVKARIIILAKADT